MKHKVLILLTLIALSVSACGQLEFGTEDNSGNQPEIAADGSIEETPNPSQTPVKDSLYWEVVEDNRTGIRFAIPCYWTANIPQPEQDPSGLGTIDVSNFDEDYVRRIANKPSHNVWMHGGVSLYIGYLNRADYNLAADADLETLANGFVNPDDEHGINSTHPVHISGREALQVEVWDEFENNRFYLIPVDSNLVLRIGPYPDKAAEHPDVQAVLQSLAFSQDEEMIIPTHKPADPPDGMGAVCIGVPASEIPVTSEADAGPLQGSLNCQWVTENDPLMWTACNIQDSFRSGNTMTLPSYMRETFTLIHWHAEVFELTPDQAKNEIVNNLMPPNTGFMTFTTDETLFPSRPGNAPPPGTVEEIYSEGWGQDGQGAALLYIAQDSNGRYYFSGMMYSEQHFDK
ncbi:MAG: hypothetical protein PVI99_03490 [Anaerolineales bacterium]|jgi:hypothetical protein